MLQVPGLQAPGSQHREELLSCLQRSLGDVVSLELFIIGMKYPLESHISFSVKNTLALTCCGERSRYSACFFFYLPPALSANLMEKRKGFEGHPSGPRLSVSHHTPHFYRFLIPFGGCVSMFDLRSLLWGGATGRPRGNRAPLGADRQRICEAGQSKRRPSSWAALLCHR